MNIDQEIPQGSVLRMVQRHRQVAVDPLIVAIVVHSNHIDVVGPAAKLRAHAAGEKVERIELRQGVMAGRMNIVPVVRARNDIIGRLGRDRTSARLDIPDRLDCRDCYLHQMAFSSCPAFLKSGETDAISQRMFAVRTFGAGLWAIYGFVLGNLPVLIFSAIGLLLCSTILVLNVRGSRTVPQGAVQTN